MLVQKVIHDRILNNMIAVPPETGGIIGGKNGIVTNFEFDKYDVDNSFENSYTPNVDYLNKIITRWLGEGIRFLGIFHSHVENEVSLSLPDRGYIQQIMESIPDSIERLYFPLIFPRKKMLVFVAQRDGNVVKIREEEVVLLRNGKIV